MAKFRGFVARNHYRGLKSLPQLKRQSSGTKGGSCHETGGRFRASKTEPAGQSTSRIQKIRSRLLITDGVCTSPLNTPAPCYGSPSNRVPDCSELCRNAKQSGTQFATPLESRTGLFGNGCWFR
jgi:hypothetical protein